MKVANRADRLMPGVTFGKKKKAAQAGVGFERRKFG